nr:hypothetical protein WG33_0050 [uncultured bacterium]
MAVVIQDFEAVQEGAGGAAGKGGKSPPATGPTAHAALDQMINRRRARQLRLWAS